MTIRYLHKILMNVYILYFSVKSLAAAGKFKNRRYKKDTNTSKQSMGAFLSWFRGSQALDRFCLTSLMLDFIFFSFLKGHQAREDGDS